MKYTKNLALKIAAVFVVFFTTIGFFVGLVGAVYTNENKIYEEAGDYFYSEVYDAAISSSGYSLVSAYFSDGHYLQDYILSGISRYSKAETNLVFQLTDIAGNIYLYNGELDETLRGYTEQYYGYLEGEIYPLTEYDISFVSNDMAVLMFRGGINPDFSASDNYKTQFNLYTNLYRYRNAFIWLMVLCGLALAIAVVFLFCAAGHREGAEGITLNPIDKIPYDIQLCGTAFSAGMLVWAFAEIFNRRVTVYTLVATFLCIGITSLVVLQLLLTTATRVKYGGWLKNTVIYRVIRGCFRLIGRIIRGFINTTKLIAIEWRITVVGAATMFGIFLLSVESYHASGLVFVVFIADAILLAICCFLAYQLRLVTQASEKIAEGKLKYAVERNKLHGNFREIGDNLNSISEGMQIAVEEQIKSERLKTELITNVSHDIKTPLTSIINYIDLLKKEDLGSDALEYAAILEKHANRLKRLTNDIVEASKAATGNIQAELEIVNICELINQAVGEYDERLAVLNIDPIVTMPETDMHILADGRLIWRVLDNLLSNAAKYSQSGTRLYISLFNRGDTLLFQMKNISKDKLNINAEELTERFVRGDSARHSEGSGLGLNIARSLVELQNGEMKIDIDGDLFKVEIIFERIVGYSPAEELLP